MTWTAPYSQKLLNYANGKSLSYDEGGFYMFENASFPSIRGIGDDFEKMVERTKYNKSIKVFFHHHILSFTEKDNPSSEALEDITRKHIELWGFDKTLVFAAVHKGRNRGKHIHLVAGNIGFGPKIKSLRIDRYHYTQNLRELERYQIEKHRLTDSIVYINKPLRPFRNIEREEINGRKENLYHAKKRSNGRALVKEEITNLLHKLLAGSTTYDHFIDNVMQTPELEVYQRKNETVGVVYKKYKFRFGRLGITQAMFKDLEKDEQRQVQQMRMNKLEALIGKQNKKQINRHLGKQK